MVMETIWMWIDMGMAMEMREKLGCKLEATESWSES